MRRIIVVIVVLLVAGGGIYYAWAVRGNASIPVAPPTPAGRPSSFISGGEVVAGADVLPLRFAELNLAATGIVSDVLVSAGDNVKQGQILVRLDAKRQAAGVQQAQSELERVQSVQAAGQAGLAKAQAGLAKAQAGLAQLKAGPRPEEIAMAAAALGVAQAQLAKAQAGADTTSLATARANMEKAARAVQQAQFAFDQVKNAPGGANGAQALALEQATVNYDLAKTVYEQLQLGPPVVDVNVAKAQVQQALAALALAQTGPRPEAITAAAADVTAAEADVTAADSNAKAATAAVATANAALQQAQAALADTELRAPFDGTVVTVNVKRGEERPLGTYIVRLADLTQWKLQTKDLTELSVSRVQLGAAVDITFDAIPDAALTGKVTRIDGFGTNRQGDIVYAVSIAPDKLDPRMRWNMTASVHIKTP